MHKTCRRSFEKEAHRVGRQVVRRRLEGVRRPRSRRARLTKAQVLGLGTLLGIAAALTSDLGPRTSDTAGGGNG